MCVWRKAVHNEIGTRELLLLLLLLLLVQRVLDMLGVQLRLLMGIREVRMGVLLM